MATRAVVTLTSLATLAGGCRAPARRPGTVVYASGADLEAANPLVTVHQLTRQLQRYGLFVTLARYDTALVPVPYAARHWRWSADLRELTLTLAPDLRWQDGVATTARDVVFTVDAARDPRTGYPRYADLTGITSITAPADTTVVVRYTTPQPTFPDVFCDLPILPAHLLSEVPHSELRRAAFNQRPVGNGPFTLVHRDVGQRWIFARNPAFPVSLGGPARLERIVVAVVDEPTTKFAGLVSGELDVAGVSPAMASLVRRDASLRIADYPTLVTAALVFNPSRLPFDDPRVRRAVSLSIDRSQVIDVALGGFGVPASGPVTPANPLALRGNPALDPSRADSLLEDAGWRRGPDGVRVRGGHRLAFELLTVGSGDNAVEQVVQAGLARRGISMTIRQAELGSFLAAAHAKEKRFDALLTGIPGDMTLAYLVAMYDSRLAESTLDYGGFHTARLDSLFARTRTAPTRAQLADAWLDVQAELDREMPAAWIYHSRGVQGLSRRLRGVRMDLRGELATLHDWWLTR